MSAPRISRVTPEPRSANVSLTPTVTILWDQDLDDTSVSTSSLYLTRTSDHAIVTPSEVTVTRNLIEFTLDVTLTPGSDYVATLNAGIANLLGEINPSPFTWTFTTDTVAGLPAPTFVSPDDAAHVDTLETSWTSSGDGVTYALQYCPLREFSGPNLHTYEDLVDTSFEPEDELGAGTYFMRVCAVDGDVYSAWSPVIGIAYNLYVTAEEEPPGLGSLWEESATSFHCIATSPANNSAGTAVTSIVLTFTHALETSPPNPVVIGEPIIGGTISTPTITWVASGSTLTGTGTFASNTVYTVTLPATLEDSTGNLLTEALDLSFTTELSVLYATPTQLRRLVGPNTMDYADDYLYGLIFMASVQANANRLGLGLAMSDSRVTTPLADQYLTLDLMEETLLRAKLLVLQARHAELSSQASGLHRLGDFSYDDSWSNLALLWEQIEHAHMELQSYEARGTTAVRSSQTLASVIWGPSPSIRRTW